MTTNSSHSTTNHHDTETEYPDSETLAGRVTSARFRTWYQEREIRKNIQNGQPYYNGPSPIKDPTQQSPSKLLQCHRQIAYQELNAPEEQEDPTGIFWFGTRFEEEVALPFLQEEVTGDNTYACNTLWVDFDVETETTTLHIKGATDPVVVTRDGTPLLVTEIKTTSSVTHLEAPNQHHKAQAHAYMYGLSEKHDTRITDAVILYASRDQFDIVAFHVEFDPAFWADTIHGWAATHAEYRLNDELPPADPMFDWECEFCAYQHRCGEADTEYSDVGAAGFLPLFTYPKTKVVEYLRAHDEAKLTPTLACQYPDLVDQYGIFQWQCVACSATYAWDEPEWDHDPAEPPVCPECLADGTPAPLKGPDPGDQHTIKGGKEDE